MEFQKVLLKDIKPAEYNPRKISGETFERLKRNIKEFGYVDPIVWNKRTNQIVGGHQRYKALLDLGYEEAEIVVLDLDETQEKILNVGLNQISGEWNLEQLKDVLLEIDVGGVDVELSGFSLDEIENMMTRTYQEFDNEEVNLDDFEDENFDCKCPECGFYFNTK